MRSQPALRSIVTSICLAGYCVACGGGGSNDPTASLPPPPPPLPPALAVNQNNALQAAVVSMVLPGASLQLADLAAGAVRAVLSRAEQQFTINCDLGGEADFDFSDANLDGVPGDGDAVTVNYRSCLVTEFQQTGTGMITLTFVDPSEPWTSEDKFFRGTMDATQLVADVASSLDFELHFGLLEELHRAYGDISFQVNIDGVDYLERLDGFSVSKHADLQTARNEISYSGTLISELLDGTLDYDVNTELSGFLNTYPEHGRFEAVGASGSRVAVVPYNVPNSTLAEIQFDASGDGVFASLGDREFWSSLTPDFTWSYSPTNQQYIRPFDPDDFWFVGGSPVRGDVIPVGSSLRLQFSRVVDTNSLPATVPMQRVLDEPPFLEVYEAATDSRGAAIVLRPLQQLRHGSEYDYPLNMLAVSDRNGNTATSCCQAFSTTDNLVAIAKASPVFGINQSNIELDGSLSSSNEAAITSYSWRQLNGTPAVLTNANQPVASLQVPAVPTPQLLEVQMEIADANGELEWDTVNVHAFPDVQSVSLAYFFGDEDDYVSLGREWFLSSASSTTSVQRDSYNGIRFSSGTWNLFFVATGDADIQVGSYENALRYQTIGSDNPELSIFGDGRSCNTSTGRFDVLEVEYDSNGDVLVAAIDFEQYCDGSAAGLTGYLRVGSSLPIPPRS